MGSLLIRNGTVLTEAGLQPRVDVRVEDGVVEAIQSGLATGVLGEVLDAADCVVAPGFVDIHIHGAAGAMCEQGDPDAVAQISSTLTRFGVTGFLATIASLPPAPLRTAVSAVAAVEGREPGARILGIHLEGPYLNPLRAGAQPRSALRLPSLEEFDQLQNLAGGLIRLVTVAPEVEGGLEFISGLRQRRVAVAIGHSDATEEQMIAGLRAGAAHVTHLFNAMRGLHHREPGVIGVGLTRDDVSVEVICDGHHLAPRIVDLVARCKPPGRLVLVSDAVAALGEPEGEYALFGLPCVIRGGAVRLKDTDTLAGSCLGLDRAVRNLRAWAPHWSLEQVLNAATSAPTAVFRGQAGGLSPGTDADLVVLDAGLEVVATICRGRLVWRR